MRQPGKFPCPVISDTTRGLLELLRESSSLVYSGQGRFLRGNDMGAEVKRLRTILPGNERIRRSRERRRRETEVPTTAADVVWVLPICQASF